MLSFALSIGAISVRKPGRQFFRSAHTCTFMAYMTRESLVAGESEVEATVVVGPDGPPKRRQRRGVAGSAQPLVLQTIVLSHLPAETVRHVRHSDQ